MASRKNKRKIGWCEMVDFTDFGLENVPAKIDTGAKTSVLHCSSIELVKKFRKSYVKFVPLDNTLSAYSGKEFTFLFHKEKRVRSSFGQEENRYIVQTKIKLFGKHFIIELSLRDRSNLEFPVLLGRSFLKSGFIVDVTKKNLSYKNKQKKLAKQAAEPATI